MHSFVQNDSGDSSIFPKVASSVLKQSLIALRNQPWVLWVKSSTCTKKRQHNFYRLRNFEICCARITCFLVCAKCNVFIYKMLSFKLWYQVRKIDGAAAYGRSIVDVCNWGAAMTEALIEQAEAMREAISKRNTLDSRKDVKDKTDTAMDELKQDLSNRHELMDILEEQSYEVSYSSWMGLKTALYECWSIVGHASYCRLLGNEAVWPVSSQHRGTSHTDSTILWFRHHARRC